jgi:hypothetical protein
MIGIELSDGNMGNTGFFLHGGQRGKDRTEQV